MVGLEIAVEDRFVVGNSIPEPAQGVQAPMNPIPPHVPARLAKGAEEAPSPKGGVVSRPQQADPGAEVEFSDNTSCRYELSGLQNGGLGALDIPADI
jgi:hypothetical protein